MAENGKGPDPLDLVRKLAESYRGIKFGRGVVGKTSHATIALFGIWAIVLFRLSDSVLLDAMLLGGGIISTCIYCWWVRKTQDFATTNPGLAMLEGAEFIEYQKWEAEIKGQPTPKSPLIPNPHATPALSDAELRKE